MAWAIYCVSVLDGLKSALGVLSFVLGFVSFLFFVVSGEKVAALGVLTAAVLAMADCLLPSSRGAAAMVVLPALVSGETAQLPEELTALTREWISEFHQEKKRDK